MHIYDTPPHIAAFSTTREGHVSISIPRLVMPHHQTHETRTVVVDEAFLRANPLEQALALDGVDALTTHLPNVCVAVKTADCIPVLLWSDSPQVVSAVHAGWKGTMRRVVECHIDVLQSTYGIHPQQLHAIIGPGIGLDSFEVGDEVYDLFAQAQFPMDKIAKQYPPMHPHTPNALPSHREEGLLKEYKWHIDLWECNRLQLIKKGVNPQNIYVSGIDTYIHYMRFFSARRHLNGRIINGIMMKGALQNG